MYMILLIVKENRFNRNPLLRKYFKHKQRAELYFSPVFIVTDLDVILIT